MSQDRPNLVLILVDDLGWSDLHCYGHTYHRTPHIDRLAERGMRFTNGYSPAPICSAARASILTGKTTARLGFEFVTKNEPGYQKLDSSQPLRAPPFTLNLALEEKTIAEYLTPLGYETAFFGKWHVNQHYERRYLAWHPKFGPRAQGFDVAHEDFGDHPYAWKKKSPPKDLPDGRFPDDSMVERVAEYIRGPHNRPFFVMASSFYVHTPVRNRCRWLVEQYESRIPNDSPNRKKRLEYAAFVETLDHHIGTILDAVEASGKSDNTLVVFLSDNGGHPEFCSNAPLRGSKWNLYEGGVRVPMIACWPNRIEESSLCETPVIGYDLLPTFVAAAGVRADDIKSDDIDGESFMGALEGQEMTERSLVWHFPYYHPETTFSKALDVIGVGDFAVSKTRPQSALRRGRHKLIQFAEDGRVELYDLEQDVSEQKDLSGQFPKTASELERELEEKLEAMKARRAVRVKP